MKTIEEKKKAVLKYFKFKNYWARALVISSDITTNQEINEEYKNLPKEFK